jgi:hypothetical protein
MKRAGASLVVPLAERVAAGTPLRAQIMATCAARSSMAA